MLPCASAQESKAQGDTSTTFRFSFYYILYSAFNSTVTWLIVNAKNGLDFALRHLSNFVYIYITVEECRRKGMCALHIA